MPSLVSTTTEQKRSAVARCCLNSAAMLRLADIGEWSDRQLESIRKSNEGQAGLLEGAADLADEMLAELRRLLARFERCAASMGNQQDVIDGATESVRNVIAKAEGRA